MCFILNLHYLCKLFFVNMAKKKKIISYFLVALFVSYYTSVTLFYHSHIINGVTIVHSHLHTASHHNTQNGGHGTYSITLIAQISHFDSIDFSYNCVLQPTQLLLHKNKCTEIAQRVTSIHLQTLSLRAPPVV